MKKRGFTLIEIIVSTAIFTVVATVAIGALTSLNKASREARAMRVVLDNANSAVDSMARTIRMGTAFDCGCTKTGTTTSACRITSTTNIDNGTDGLSCLRFQGPSDLSGGIAQIKYDYNSGSVWRTIGAGAPQQLTSAEVEVSGLKFYVNGVTADQDQPVVTMLLTGVAHISNLKRDFSIQTTISPRTPNSVLVNY